jgi:Terminase RNaseH-like domain
MTADLDLIRATNLRIYQVETLQALVSGMDRRPGGTFTVLYPRQAGKNEVGAAFVAYLLVTNAREGGSVILCAPTFSPQAQVSLSRVRRAVEVLSRRVPLGAAPRLSGETLTVGHANVTFLSASPEAHVAGHTASLALIADEAQDIDEAWFDRQFRPMAASTGAPAVLFGTPWNGETLLDRAVAANRLLDRGKRRATSRLHHEVSWEQVGKAVPHYGDYVRSERRRLGAAHPLFVTQYGLRPLQAAGRLFSLEELERMEGGHARLRLPAQGERYVAGLDFGGEGPHSDATVLTIARVTGESVEVVEHVAVQGRPFAEARAAIGAAIAAWRPAHVCADATGLGAALAADLRHEHGDQVEGVTFTARSKSDMGYALIAAARTGRLRLYANDRSPDAQACRDELRLCTANALSAGRLRWAAPAGAHDDYAASLALCLRAATLAPQPRVARGRRAAGA